MAHFAQLDSNNVVTQVIVVHNNELLDNGVENESKGIAFCQSLFGGNGGSGIVIIRYPDSSPAAAATTGSPTITVSGGYRIYQFTGSGSITF